MVAARSQCSTDRTLFLGVPRRCSPGFMSNLCINSVMLILFASTCPASSRCNLAQCTIPHTRLRSSRSCMWPSVLRRPPQGGSDILGRVCHRWMMYRARSPQRGLRLCLVSQYRAVPHLYGPADETSSVRACRGSNFVGAICGGRNLERKRARSMWNSEDMPSPIIHSISGGGDC